MATFLTIGSKFKPYTYDEMLKPIQASTEAQRQIEDAYSDLGVKADVLTNMIDPNLDPELYSTQQSYVKDLQGAANQLAEEGLTPGSRQSLLQMKSRYSRDITPIEAAYTKREADIKRQQDISDKTGGQTIFSKYAEASKIGDYYGSKTPEYTQANLDDVFKESMTGSTGMSSRYFNTEEGKAFQGTYLVLTTEQGMTPEQAMQVMNDSGNYPEFTKFYNNLRSKHHYNEFDAVDRARMDSAIYAGANAGIMHKVDPKLYQNWVLHAAMSRSGKNKGEAAVPPPAYRRVQLTEVVGSNTSKLKSYVDLLKKIKENPRMADEKIGTIGYGGGPFGGMTSVDPAGGMTVDLSPIQETLKEINKVTGMEVLMSHKDGKLTDNNIDEVVAKLNKMITSSAVEESRFTLNVTDIKPVAKAIIENGSIRVTNNKKSSGAYKFEDGEVDEKMLDNTHIGEYLKDITSFSFDPKLSKFIITSNDEDGSPQAMAIDPQVIDDANGTLRETIRGIKADIKNEDDASALNKIDAMMNVIYKAFNLKAKIQSTTGKDEEIDYTASYRYEQ